MTIYDLFRYIDLLITFDNLGDGRLNSFVSPQVQNVLFNVLYVDRGYDRCVQVFQT